MSFIGEGQNPAPKLKDAKLSDAEYELAYDQCVQVCLIQLTHLISPSESFSCNVLARTVSDNSVFCIMHNGA